MAFNNIFQLTVWADYGNEQNTLAHRRGRLIAPTADVSAFDGWSDVRMKYSMSMIVPTAD
jgi:hypothetical protein